MARGQTARPLDVSAGSVTLLLSPAGGEWVLEGERWQRAQVGLHLACCLAALLAEGWDTPEFREWAKEVGVRRLPPIPRFRDEREEAHSLLALSLVWLETLARPLRSARQVWAKLVVEGDPEMPDAWERVVGGYRGCSVVPFARTRKGRPVFCWWVWAPGTYEAACAELVLMILHNIRTLRICPRCERVYWGEEQARCPFCPRPPKDAERETFLGTLRKADERAKKGTGRLTREQIEAVREVLRKHGLRDAECVYTFGQEWGWKHRDRYREVLEWVRERGWDGTLSWLEGLAPRWRTQQQREHFLPILEAMKKHDEARRKMQRDGE